MNGDGGAKVSAKAAYIRECEDYASAIILPERKALPTIENGVDYDPHRWAQRS